MKKAKKEKVIYIDDGRTLADMSGVSGGRFSRRNKGRPLIRFQDAWKTYWGAVKMMLPATLIFTLALGLIYLLLWLAFKLA